MAPNGSPGPPADPPPPTVAAPSARSRPVAAVRMPEAAPRVSTALDAPVPASPIAPPPTVERSPLTGLTPSLLSLDDRRHGVRIVAALRREFGIGDATLFLGRKAAAKIAGLSERDRFLLGLAHAVVIKTGKTLAYAWAALDRIANEVA
jgi:hypothetical protein